LEARLLAANKPDSPSGKSRIASAAQIDNESLRDQVHHLQRKITALEDTLEEVQSTSEKERVLLREKVKRLKEREEATKKELNEGRIEVEKMLKSESTARARVQEIEEALRENTLALENARAEVEILRGELTVSRRPNFMTDSDSIHDRILMVWPMAETRDCLWSRSLDLNAH
jgi:CAP-Gly domain-containing linker protein 1